MAESTKIIENGFLIACDRQGTMGFFALLVKDDRIAEISNRSDGFKARFPNAEIVDASEKILFPGFIDAHYHGESFVLRNWTTGIPMARWHKDHGARNILKYVYRQAGKDELTVLYRAAYFSALKSGITFISEFCFDNLDAPFVAAREAMKRSDLKGFVGAHNGEQVEQARIQSFQSVRNAMVLPGEDDLTTYNLQTTLRTASEFHWPIVSHLGETRRGLETLKRNFNRSVARILDEYRLFTLPLQLVHCVSLEEGDQSFLAKAQTPLILNAASILSKGSEVPPLDLLMGAGMTLALCSDWGAPDPFENMRALQLLVRMRGMEALDPRTVLAAHTLNAARALGVQDETGSIESGKKADIAFLDVSDLRLQLALLRGNQSTILSNLIAQATTQMVSDVMINGEFFLRKRQVMTYAEEDLKKEYREILERFALRSGMPLSEPGIRSIPEESKQATPILPLTTTRPAVHPETGDLMNEPFDEGFRIVGTNGAPDAPPRKPDPEEKEKDRELPKTARRVFGDDDI
ncbi:MAG TPA: amidohydrolase family protein [Bacteroidota bacterium]|nr:amidohydrolase family protein [Bacteroidota bacterium]